MPIKMRVHVYYPSERFAAISITNRTCALQCRHCKGKFLRGMVPAPTPRAFLETCERLRWQGTRGVLVSGGFTKEGSLYGLAKFADALRAVKTELGFSIALHGGFVAGELVRKLRFIDAWCFDVVADARVARELLGLEKTPREYAQMLSMLPRETLTPHICIGLDRGNLSHEFNSLRIIRKSAAPKVIVFLVLVPDSFPEAQLPRVDDVVRVIRRARQLFPDTALALGCMRPRTPIDYRLQLELASVAAGVTRVALPSAELLRRLHEKGCEITTHNGCCVFIGMRLPTGKRNAAPAFLLRKNAYH